MIKYTEAHEWLKLEDGIVTVGITQYAADELGDIVYIELPEMGSEVEAGDEVVVIESVKTASDISASLDGEITEVNGHIVDDPATINADAMAAWFFKMKIDDESALDGFMDEAAYQEMIS